MSYVRQPREYEYPRLLERARQCLPNSTTVVGTLEIFTDKIIPKFSKTKLWIPNEPESLPFFIVITNSEEFQLLLPYWDTGSIDQSILLSLLSSFPDFDWRKFIRLHTVHEPLLDELEILLSSEVLSGSSLRRFVRNRAYVLEGRLLSLPRMTLPAGFELRDISNEHIKYVENHWEYAKENTRGLMEFSVKNLGSSAIYTNDPDSNGLPVSWTIFKFDSQIGATYTNPKFRGNNLASIVTVDILQKMLKIGYHPYILVVKSNIKAIKFHSKLGFHRTSSVGWDYYVPANGIGIPDRLKYLFE